MEKLHLLPSVYLKDGLAAIHNRITGKTGFSDAVDLAVELEEIGFDELLLIDVNGTASGRFNSFEVLSDISDYTELDILCGGGLRDERTVEEVFASGASRVILETMAVEDREKTLNLVDIYGSNSLVIGIDIDSSGITVEGRTKKVDMLPGQLLAFYNSIGINRFIIQPVDESGNKIPPDIDFYERICSAFPMLRIYAGEGLDNTWQFDQFEKAGLAGMVIGDEFYTDEKLFFGLKKYLYS